LHRPVPSIIKRRTKPALAGRTAKIKDGLSTHGRRCPHFIVFANEKGGTGKSTTAVHTAVALAAGGRRVAALDLDTRQRTLGRYLDNRGESIKRTGVALPMPRYETFDPDKHQLDAVIEDISRDVDMVVIDTPAATIPMPAPPCFAPTLW
jgi:Mrp family chromosome partitioning ATPase